MEKRIQMSSGQKTSFVISRIHYMEVCYSEAPLYPILSTQERSVA